MGEPENKEAFFVSEDHSEAEEIKRLKTWLFRENIRIQNEKNELEAMREKLIEDRVTFRNEMNILNNRMTVEQKRIKEEEQFIEKKMQILKDGFNKLERDRKSFESEQLLLEEKKKTEYLTLGKLPEGDRLAHVLFRSAVGDKSVQKRYRELLKIFHPDNKDGDAELVQYIMKEYECRKDI